MKKRFFWNFVYALVFLLLLSAEAMAVAAVIKLDMLPKLYLAGVIGIFALLSLAVGLMLFVQGKGTGKTRKILACVLALLIVCGCAVISTVAMDVMKTLEATNEEVAEIPTREIYVLAQNPAQELVQTIGFTYGYVKHYEEGCTQQVLDAVREKTAGQVSVAGYTDTFTMVRALLAGKIDAMILNGGFTSILEETEEFMGFSQKTRILAQIPVTETEELPLEMPEEEEPEEATIAPSEPEDTQPQEEEIDFTTLEPFVVYLSGSDSYGTKIVKTGRSDVNILAIVNPMTKQVLLLNTPRDYYVRNSAGGGARDKLTHCGIYGTKCSMKTLGNLYDVEIEYYARINFEGFKKFIDALGGVTVYSDYAFTAITRTPIKKGENKLNGQEALDFARERYTLKGGDNERGKHQMQVITAVIKKATSGTTIISNYSEILASIEGMFQMNIPTELITAMMKMQLSDMAQWNIVSYAVTGTGSMEPCYSVTGMDLSVIVPSQRSVDKAIRLKDMVFNGELLTEEAVSGITE